MRRLVLLLFVLSALAPVGSAYAGGGNYVIEGGSDEAKGQVRAALEASAFDWDVVRERITIRITRCGCAGATPGEIVLDEDTLTRSPFGPRYAWGIVQHEYAHQVDFFVLTPRQRTTLRRRVGAPVWCWETRGYHHDDYGCERFATLVAWAYWPSSENVQRPLWARPGSATVPWRVDFRRLLGRLLAGPLGGTSAVRA